MTTDTLERTDLEHLLDDEPMCVNAGECGRAATLRLRLGCGCCDIACQPCIDRFIMRLVAALLTGGPFYCLRCRQSVRARYLSDLLTVVPL